VDWEARGRVDLEGERRAREDEGEEKGEALEDERSGGRKAEVFVDRGKESKQRQRQVSQRRCVVVVVNYQQGTMLCVRVMPSRGRARPYPLPQPDPVRRPLGGRTRPLFFLWEPDPASAALRHENNLSFLPPVPHPATLRGQVQETEP
jgi:hypothetical protein